MHLLMGWDGRVSSGVNTVYIYSITKCLKGAVILLLML